VFAVGNARSTRHAATAVSYYGRWAIQKSDDGARSFCPICSRRRRNVTVLQHDLIDIVEHDVQDVLTDIARLKFRGITFFVQDQSMSTEVERRTTANHAMKTARGAWNTVSRANPGLFPAKNPFEKMGLQSTSRTVRIASRCAGSISICDGA